MGTFIKLSILLLVTTSFTFGQCRDSWELTQQINPISSGIDASKFGSAIATDGNRLVVGAFKADFTGNNAGSVYVYERGIDGDWISTSRIDNSSAIDPNVNFDFFGKSVDVSGDYLIVGAPYDEYGSGLDSGTAYLFYWNGNNWELVIELKPSDAIRDSYFGHSVAIKGERIVVGAYREDINIDGEVLDDAGAAYVFEKQPTGNWIEVAKLVALNPEQGDEFGTDVEIDEYGIYVGAPFGGGGETGEVFEYIRSGGSWNFYRKLEPGSGVESNSFFGWSIDSDSEGLVIGAPSEDSNGVNAGAVFVFERESGDWVEVVKLIAEDGAVYDDFGVSVNISKDLILVGAPEEDAVAEDSGSAYLYTKTTSGNWIEINKFTPTDLALRNEFGSAVVLVGNEVITGSSSASTETSEGEESLRIYNLEQEIGERVPTQKLFNELGNYADRFGRGLSTSGTSILVGAAYEEGSGPNMNNVGKAYLYELSEDQQIWEVTSVFEASDGSAQDNFGQSLHLDLGSKVKRVAIASPYSETEDDVNFNSGSVFIYEYDDLLSSWIERSQFYPEDVSRKDYFGGNATFGNGLTQNYFFASSKGDDDMGEDSGAIYVYDVSDLASPLFVQKLVPPNESIGDKANFGCGISISSGRIAIGANAEKNDSLPGSVYIYDLNVETGLFVLSHQIVDDVATDTSFGHSLELQNNRLIVGAPQDALNGYLSGAAYIFVLNSISKEWELITRLEIPYPEDQDNFGEDVDIKDDYVLVSSRKRACSYATNQSSVAFLFGKKNNGEWRRLLRYSAESVATNRCRFGEGFVISGCPQADGVNEDTEGAAYIFRGQLPDPDSLILAEFLPGSDGSGDFDDPNAWSTGRVPSLDTEARLASSASAYDVKVNRHEVCGALSSSGAEASVKTNGYDLMMISCLEQIGDPVSLGDEEATNISIMGDGTGGGSLQACIVSVGNLSGEAARSGNVTELVIGDGATLSVDSLGACCLGEACDVLPQTICESYGGYFLSGEDCATTFCPSNGACCIVDSCESTDWFTCITSGGVFNAGLSCNDLQCGLRAIPEGACCLTSECEWMRSVDCWKNGGQFLGAGELCETSNCQSNSRGSRANMDSLVCGDTSPGRIIVQGAASKLKVVGSIGLGSIDGVSGELNIIEGSVEANLININSGSIIAGANSNIVVDEISVDQGVVSLDGGDISLTNSLEMGLGAGLEGNGELIGDVINIGGMLAPNSNIDTGLPLVINGGYNPFGLRFGSFAQGNFSFGGGYNPFGRISRVSENIGKVNFNGTVNLNGGLLIGRSIRQVNNEVIIESKSSIAGDFGVVIGPELSDGGFIDPSFDIPGQVQLGSGYNPFGLRYQVFNNLQRFNTQNEDEIIIDLFNSGFDNLIIPDGDDVSYLNWNQDTDSWSESVYIFEGDVFSGPDLGNTKELAAGDIDGDNAVDIIIGKENGIIILNQNANTFDVSQTILFSSPCMLVDIELIPGLISDSMDLFVACGGESSRVMVFENQSNLGSFNETLELNLPGEPLDLAGAGYNPFDRKKTKRSVFGSSNLILTGGFGGIGYNPFGRRGTFSETTYDFDQGVDFIIPASGITGINGEDVVIANDTGLSVLRRTDSGDFESAINLPFATGEVIDVDAADIDRDGDTDLIIIEVEGSSRSVRVLRNDRNLSSTNSLIFTILSDPLLIDANAERLSVINLQSGLGILVASCTSQSCDSVEYSIIVVSNDDPKEPKVPCDGDATGDDVVDVLDLLEVIGNFGGSSGSADINNDGAIDVLDLLEVIGNFGQSCTER